MSNAQYSGQLPSRDSVAGNDDGTLTTVWYSFMTWLASLTAADVEQTVISVGPSYTFQASKIGHLHVAAGSASSVVLQRGGVSLACPTSGFIPVVAGDEVTIDLAVQPSTFTFIPGART